MSRKARRVVDPLEREIGAALEPGHFVYDRACHSFVRGLEAVERDVSELIRTAPDRAVGLYEAFLAGCFEKAGEVDDSSGSFGMFVQDLFCGWTKARQAAGADPADTATRLLAWMDDDPFGFCYRLEKDLAKVLDKGGLAALTEQVWDRFEAAPEPASAAGEQPDTSSDYRRRRWSGILRTLYLAQKDIDSYVRLAEETGLTADDCHAAATMLVARRDPGEALSWVERGIELATKSPHESSAGYELRQLKPRLLEKLGRRNEALQTVWAEFREHPSRYSYDDLMRFVPNGERSVWHHKAIDAATGAGLGSHMELLLHTKETDRLDELVRRSTDDSLDAVSPFVAEEAAKKLERIHPAEASRLWRALGVRIVGEKKSKSYPGALRYFERAKRCYEKAGLVDEWDRLVAEIRREHHRKTAFIPGFEGVVRGSGPSKTPTFLERAKARCHAPRGRMRCPGPGAESGSRCPPCLPRC